jgi:membrane protein DedA with SNARE-associated domain
MPLASFTLWTGLGAGIWVVVLTVIGYAIGTHTTAMGYGELVHTGKAIVSRHMVWLVPALLVGLGSYIWISSKIMSTKRAAEPSVTS